MTCCRCTLLPGPAVMTRKETEGYKEKIYRPKKHQTSLVRLEQCTCYVKNSKAAVVDNLTCFYCCTTYSLSVQ